MLSCQEQTENIEDLYFVHDLQRKKEDKSQLVTHNKNILKFRDCILLKTTFLRRSQPQMYKPRV